MRYIMMTALLLSATTVRAELTPTEKQEVVNQIDGLKQAYQSLDWATRYGKIDAAAIPNIAEFGRRLVAEQRKHVRGLLAITDVNYSDSPPSVGGLVNGPRATVVADGVALLQSVNYPYARSKLQQIRDGCISGCNDLDTALGLVDNAITAVGGFNATLPYTDPIVDEQKLPGWTRDITAMAGPHGDYRFFGREMINAHNKDQGSATTRMYDAYEVRPEMADHADDWIQHMQLAMRYTLFSLGLMAGVEHPDVADDVQIILDGITAADRGRHFARVLLIDELMLNRVDTGSYLPDINGRNKIRGVAYEYNRLCQEFSRSMRDDATLPTWLNEIAWGYELVCSAWQKMDNGIFNGTMGLKYFQAFPPPQQSGLTCGAGTTEVLGECVATIQSCGPGASMVGSACVGDPVVCPSYQAQLVVLADRIEAQCVEGAILP